MPPRRRHQVEVDSFWMLVGSVRLSLSRLPANGLLVGRDALLVLILAFTFSIESEGSTRA